MRPILAQMERLIPKPIIQITELRRCTIILIPVGLNTLGKHMAEKGDGFL